MPHAGLNCAFFVDALPDLDASRAAGRPISRDVVRVRITTLGGTAVVQDLRADHVERFPEEFAAFRARRERAATGAPLEDWPVIGPAELEELKELGLRSVEDVAGLDDAAIEELGDRAAVFRGGLLRDRARAFADNAVREALLSRVIAENDELRRRLTAAERQVAGLTETLERIRLLQLPPDRPGQGMVIDAPLPMAPAVAASALDALAARRLSARRQPQEAAAELPLAAAAEPVEFPHAAAEVDAAEIPPADAAGDERG
jgi:predicted flap endonuclease-1-like 5' DNA nuclease